MPIRRRSLNGPVSRGTGACCRDRHHFPVGLQQFPDGELPDEYGLTLQRVRPACELAPRRRGARAAAGDCIDVTAKESRAGRGIPHLLPSPGRAFRRCC